MGERAAVLTRMRRAAKKLRSSILSELQHAGSAGPDADETARFEKVEGLMEK